MLEFIFQGFFEWVYSLILDIWNFFSSSLLNVMSLDFAYIKTHIPIMGDIQQVILAVGWALLLGNLVFQALRSMASGLGFEGEDPKILFARTFVFSFLLLASPQICETVLGITSTVIGLLEIPDAINVQLVDGSVFGVFTASWLLVIIFDIITMFMVLSLLLEVAERYMVLAMLTIMAPLAFAMGGSKSTSEIFAGWCRMFGSMCFLMAANIVFFKMLLSVVSTVPSFPDVFLWMVLIVSIVKVAKKADEIITRIGLNPAITGSQSTLPGMLAYTVFHTALTMATKGAANGIGGALGIVGKGAAGAGKGAAKTAGTAFKGMTGAAGATSGGSGGIAAGNASQRSDRPRYGGGRQQSQQSVSQQEHRHQQTQQFQQTRQDHQNTSGTQANGQQQTAAQERPAGTFLTERSGAARRLGMSRSSRRSFVPRGAQRAPGYVAPSSAQNKTEEQSVFRSSTNRFGETKAEISRGGVLSSQKAKLAHTGTAGPRSSQRSGTSEPRPGRNTPSAASAPPSKTQRTDLVQQEQRRAVSADRTSAKGGGPVPHPNTAETGPRSSQRPGISEPRPSRNTPSATSAPPPKAQRPGPVQQEQQRAVLADKTPAKGGGPVPHPDTAGIGSRSSRRLAAPEARPGRNIPPTVSTVGAQSPRPPQQEQRQIVSADRTPVKGGRPIPHPDTAGTGSRSSRRTANPEPRYSRNTPSAKSAPAAGAQSSRPAQQEPHQASAKGKAPVKGGAPVPRPGKAGTRTSHRTPPGQKLSGGPPASQPMRQTRRRGGERHV